MTLSGESVDFVQKMGKRIKISPKLHPEAPYGTFKVKFF